MNGSVQLYIVYSIAVLYSLMMTVLFFCHHKTRLRFDVSILMSLVTLLFIVDALFFEGLFPSLCTFKTMRFARLLIAIIISSYSIIMYKLFFAIWQGVTTHKVFTSLQSDITKYNAVRLFVTFVLLIATAFTISFHLFATMDKSDNVMTVFTFLIVLFWTFTFWVVSLSEDILSDTMPFNDNHLNPDNNVNVAVKTNDHIQIDSNTLIDFNSPKSPTILLDDNSSVPDVESQESQQKIDFSKFSTELKSLFEKEKLYLNPELRLSHLAQLLGTNRTYLSRYFNIECGCNFSDYVNKYRIEYSKTLLSSTAYTLEAIATMTGFNSLSTFRRAFLRFCGCSPSEFRIENQNTPPEIELALMY